MSKNCNESANGYVIRCLSCLSPFYDLNQSNASCPNCSKTYKD